MKICLNRNIEFFLFLHQFNCISLQFFYHHLSYCCCCSCIRAAGKNEAGKKEIEKNWQERVGNLFCRYFCFYSFLVGYIIYCKRELAKMKQCCELQARENWNDYAILLNWNGNPLSGATCGVTRFSMQKKRISIFSILTFCACPSLVMDLMKKQRQHQKMNTQFMWKKI